MTANGLRVAPPAEHPRYCFVCGVEVGRLVPKGNHFDFVPNEVCATPIPPRYRCIEHGEAR